MVAWAQARGDTPPAPAAKPVEPAPVVIPPVSAEPVSARLIIRLEQVERQAAEMTGRIEVLEAELAQQRASQARLLRELEAERTNGKLAAARTGPDGLPEAGPAELSSEGIANPDRAAEQAGPGGTAVSADSPPSLPPPPPPSAQTLFKGAEQALQRGDYAAAEASLDLLVKLHPGAPEGIEGRWLLGETRYVQSAWGPAAEAYLGYLSAAPQGRRASESLLRLAGAFGQMGNSKMRCSALAEFRRRTPTPDPTLKARADAEAARSPCPTT